MYAMLVDDAYKYLKGRGRIHFCPVVFLTDMDRRWVGYDRDGNKADMESAPTVVIS